MVWKWRTENEEPKPSHPKLLHYNTRRRAHLYKLSMVSAIDDGNVLVLRGDNFHTALGWLREIEVCMPDVFAAGSVSVDARAMDEIAHLVASQGRPVTEGQLLRFAANILPLYALRDALLIMQATGRLRKVNDKPPMYVSEEE